MAATKTKTTTATPVDPEAPVGVREKSLQKASTDVEVLIHGVVIQDVHSYDVAKGEVWCHDGDDPTKPVQLKTGTVTVRPHPLKGKG